MGGLLSDYPQLLVYLEADTVERKECISEHCAGLITLAFKSEDLH